MVHPQQHPVALSAPGKVLLAGGYLVLDRAYTGLVFGLDARIHVLVQPIPTPHGVTLSEIVVSSPQFEDAVWEFGYNWSDGGAGMRVTQLRADADLKLNRNIFLETALGYALTYIATLSTPLVPPASITILADNDYYSAPTNLPTLSNNGSTPSKPAPTTPRFHNFALPLPSAPKTGLGSSAALVTAFTAALLTYYLPRTAFDLTSSATDDRSARILHNLAQAAHCAAQGKVGSGFDVASAVYGSCLYRRFSPSILAQSADPGSRGFAAALRALVEEDPDAPGGVAWDTEILRDAVKVPPGLRLVMCDVAGGSRTPGMVKQVLAWRQRQPAEADEIWAELHAANEALASELRTLADSASSSSSNLEPKPLGLERLQATFTRIRASMRRMSAASGVPIEPPAQTALLDACSAVPGVVGGVVPGAGGYDAISLLVEDREEVVAALGKVLEGWTFEGVDAEAGRVRMLGVRQEMSGVRVERWEEYGEWRA